MIGSAQGPACSNVRMCRVGWEALISPGLMCLDLGGNRLGTEGCRALHPVLEVAVGLVTLNLSCNDICARGCEFVADGLRGAAQLSYLDLGGNRIQDDGVAGTSFHCLCLWLSFFLFPPALPPPPVFLEISWRLLRGRGDEAV